jgi:hypothetical protein
VPPPQDVRMIARMTAEVPMRTRIGHFSVCHAANAILRNFDRLQGTSQTGVYARPLGRTGSSQVVRRPSNDFLPVDVLVNWPAKLRRPA